MGWGGTFAIAGLFYGMAAYERLTAWKWALASLGISFTIQSLFPLSFIFVLPAQFGLFCIMIYANIRNKAALEVERAKRREIDQRERAARVSRARQEVSASSDWASREAERDAAEEKARNERMERVRLAREAREREEKAP
jgi:signal transduction histidine kinase